MIKFLLYLFIFWLLYKFVFDFLLPMFQTAKQVRRQMGDIQDAMRQQYEQQRAQQQAPDFGSQQKSSPKVDKDDYLDFEEIK